MDTLANPGPKGGTGLDWIPSLLLGGDPDNSRLISMHYETGPTNTLRFDRPGNYVIEWSTTNAEMSASNDSSDSSFEYYILESGTANTVVNGLPNTSNFITYMAPFGGPVITAVVQLYVTIISAPSHVVFTPLNGSDAAPLVEWPAYSASQESQSYSGYLTITKLEVYSSA